VTCASLSLHPLRWVYPLRSSQACPGRCHPAPGLRNREQDAGRALQGWTLNGRAAALLLKEEPFFHVCTGFPAPAGVAGRFGTVSAWLWWLTSISMYKAWKISVNVIARRYEPWNELACVSASRNRILNRKFSALCSNRFDSKAAFCGVSASLKWVGRHEMPERKLIKLVSCLFSHCFGINLIKFFQYAKILGRMINLKPLRLRGVPEINFQC